MSWRFKINRSLSRRVKAKTCYDKTLEELEKKYAKLLDDSKELLSYVMQQFDSLDTLLDKRIGTTDSMKKIEQVHFPTKVHSQSKLPTINKKWSSVTCLFLIKKRIC